MQNLTIRLRRADRLGRSAPREALNQFGATFCWPVAVANTARDFKRLLPMAGFALDVQPVRFLLRQARRKVGVGMTYHICGVNGVSGMRLLPAFLVDAPGR